MSNRERILVVDDLPDIRAMYDLLFTGMGFEVFTSGDGTEALRHYKDLLCPIVILDAMLPSAVSDGLNGFTLSAKIKAVNPDAITVIVTGLPDDAQTRMRILDSRADAILIKPISADRLLLEIRSIQAKKEVLKPRTMKAPSTNRTLCILLGVLLAGLSLIGAYDWHCQILRDARQEIANEGARDLVKSLFEQQERNDKTRQDDKYASMERDIKSLKDDVGTQRMYIQLFRETLASHKLLNNK